MKAAWGAREANAWTSSSRAPASADSPPHWRCIASLARSLAAEPDIDAALAAYESERRPATTKVVVSNRQEGPAEILSIVEERAPNGFDNIETIISATELAEISARYKRLAGFDQATVNASGPSRRS